MLRATTLLFGIGFTLVCSQSPPPPAPIPEEFQVGATVCLVLSQPADSVVDLDRVRLGIALVFNLFDGHVRDVQIAAEGCNYVFDGCMNHKFEDLNNSYPFGTELLYTPRKFSESRPPTALLLPTSNQLIMIKANVLTLSRYQGDRNWGLRKACDDSEADVCETYLNNRECDVSAVPRPNGESDQYLRNGIREQVGMCTGAYFKNCNLLAPST